MNPFDSFTNQCFGLFRQVEPADFLEGIRVTGIALEFLSEGQRDQDSAEFFHPK